MIQQSTFDYCPSLYNRPSIFELFAADTLDKTCYNAVSAFIKFLGTKYFPKLNISDEVSLGLMTMFQYFHLHKINASFGECFYSLERILENSTDIGLSAKKKLSSTLLLLLPQYLEAKQKSDFTEDRHFMLAGGLQLILLLYDILKSARVIAYMMHLTNSSSPQLSILSLIYRHSSYHLTNNKMLLLMLKVFEGLSFLIYFTKWRHINNKSKQNTYRSNPKNIPVSTSTPSGTCPICLQRISVATACSTSGQVYCFKCISLHLQQRKRCPVTNLPCTFDDLITIYE